MPSPCRRLSCAWNPLHTRKRWSICLLWARDHHPRSRSRSWTRRSVVRRMMLMQVRTPWQLHSQQLWTGTTRCSRHPTTASGAPCMRSRRACGWRTWQLGYVRTGRGHRGAWRGWRAREGALRAGLALGREVLRRLVGPAGYGGSAHCGDAALAVAPE